MPDADPRARVRRQFSEGLPARVKGLRSALSAVSQAYDVYLAEEFFRGAHSFKGAAACFQAQSVFPHAAALCDLGRRWTRQTATDDDLALAWRELALLETECDRYRKSVAEECA